MTTKLMPDLCDYNCPLCNQGLKVLIDPEAGERMKSNDARLCPTGAFVLGCLEIKEKTDQKLRIVASVVDS